MGGEWYLKPEERSNNFQSRMSEVLKQSNEVLKLRVSYVSAE